MESRKKEFMSFPGLMEKLTAVPEVKASPKKKDQEDLTLRHPSALGHGASVVAPEPKKTKSRKVI
jgi:hypothetical protein